MSVLPTPVGMSPGMALVEPLVIGAPHTRGDEPTLASSMAHSSRCSPHPWG